MTLQEAERIVQKYGTALARGTEGGLARRESWLPCSKEEIKKAFKVVIGFFIEFQSLTEQNYNEMILPVCYLNAFVDDSKFNRINYAHKTIKSGNIESLSPEALKEFQDYMENMTGRDIREEINKFIDEVLQLDTNDSLYHQRLYTLIGIECSPAKKNSFWDIFKFR